MLARERIERIATSLPFRIVVAIAILAIHLRNVGAMAEERFHTKFNWAPNEAPTFVRPASDHDAKNWNRLAVARWDSGHYIALALRGYTQCPQAAPPGTDLRPYLPTCNLSFYPTYPLIGRTLAQITRLPIDYALFAVSLAASFAFLLLFTSRAFTSRLGVGKTYLALLLFNAFTSGFFLVAIQTEPTFLALTLGAFVALDKRWTLAGALIAGAATAVRVSGVATGFAYGVALLVLTWREPPASKALWAKRAIELVVPAWGIAALMAYWKWRFHDPMIYFHAHEQLFSHKPGLDLDVDPLLRSIDLPPHDGVFCLVALLLFFVGRREAMQKFDPIGRAYWYGYFVVVLAIPILGTLSLGLMGMTRYLLHAIPIFFAIAAVTARRPAVLALWIAFTAWHYWQVELCFYEAGPGNHGLKACHDDHWIGHF